jgi:DNA-binding MarR family transcriptional regulator
MTDDALGFRIFTEIGILDQLAQSALAKALPGGITVAQFSVLNHFVRLELGEISPADLASAFQVTRPTMTSTLKRLARAGLVTIRPDPGDGRAKLVGITPQGRALRADCLARLTPTMAQLTAAIPPEKLAQLLPLLQSVREKLDQLRD